MRLVTAWFFKLHQLPPLRRDLIKRHLYLVPNSIVVSRGCPYACDFCYKEAFFIGERPKEPEAHRQEALI